MTKSGITSAPFLRGKSGSSNIKAWRGKAGWKEAQALKAKFNIRGEKAVSYKPKKKLSKTDAFLGGSAIGILATEQFGKPGKTTKKPITKKGWGKAYKRGG